MPKPVIIRMDYPKQPKKSFLQKSVKKGLQTLLNAFTIQDANFNVVLLFIESGYY